jgi:hypothetical protein
VSKSSRNRIAIGLAAVAAVALPAYAWADGGSSQNTGPCNLIQVMSDTDELQDDIFDHFVIEPEVTVQWVRADKIDTWFEDKITAGNITCTTSNDNSTITLRTDHIDNTAPPPEPPEPIIIPASAHGHSAAAELHYQRVGVPRTLQRQPTRQLEVGRRYRLPVGYYLGRHKLGKTHMLDFKLGCRVQTNTGCL